MDENDSSNDPDQSVEKKRLKLALFDAVEKGDCDNVSVLLTEARKCVGIDIQVYQDRHSFDYNRGNTLLHDAALNGHLEICEMLLANGADVNLQNSDGFTALHKAKSVEICQLLVKYEADFTITTRRRETVLHYASNADIAQYYISLGLNIDATTAFNQTCLESILVNPDMDRQTKLEICKVLLKNGANDGLINDDEARIEDDEISIILRAQEELVAIIRPTSCQMPEESVKKVYICGSQGSGKTTLYKSLLRSRLRSKLTVERYGSKYWPPFYRFIQGVNVSVEFVDKDYISGIRPNCYINFREFSSKTPTFFFNAIFKRAKNVIIFVLYDLSENETECKKKLVGWLSQIKANRNRKTECEPHILIIGTRADCPNMVEVDFTTRRAAQNKAAQILSYCTENFGDSLNIVVWEHPFVADARVSQNEGIIEIRNALSFLLKPSRNCPIRVQVAREPSHKIIHYMCDGILRHKRSWKRSKGWFRQQIPECSDTLFKPKFPVLKWDDFAEKVSAKLQDIDEQDIVTHLETVTTILSDWDELVFVRKRPLSDSLVVLKPKWMISKLLVPLFFAEANDKFLIPEKISDQNDNLCDGHDRVELKTCLCASGWNEIQADMIMELAENFDLLFSSATESKVILPTRLPNEPSRETDRFSSGVSYELKEKNVILLPDFFPKLLFELLKTYPKSTLLFKSGARINGPDVTGHIFVTEDHRKIVVLTSLRPDRSKMETEELKLIRKISTCIENTVTETSVTTLTLTKKFFDRKQLQGNAFETIESLKGIRSFNVQELTEAERENDGKVICSMCVVRVTDVLIKGHDFTLLNELRYSCNVIWLPDEIYGGSNGLEILFGEKYEIRDGNSRMLLIENLGLDGADSLNSVKSIVCEWATKDYKRNNILEFCRILQEMGRLDANSQVREVLKPIIGDLPGYPTTHSILINQQFVSSASEGAVEGHTETYYVDANPHERQSTTR